MDYYNVNLELVRHIAKLAALELDPAAEQRYVEELNKILGYMRQIAGVDVSGIEATFQTQAIVNLCRQDQPEASLSAEQVLRNAPAREADYIKAPPILEISS